MTQYYFQVGDEIVQQTPYLNNTYKIEKVTKTLAIAYNSNGYAHKFKRLYSKAHNEEKKSTNFRIILTRVPVKDYIWDTSQYFLIPANN